MVFLAHPSGILPDGALSCQQAPYGFLCFSIAMRPERPRCIPERGEALTVGIAILADNGLDPLRMFDGQTKSHGSSIILDIETEAFELECIEGLFHDLFQMIEGIGEMLDTRTIAIAIPRIIWRNHMKVLAENGKQVAKHMGRRWKPM